MSTKNQVAVARVRVPRAKVAAARAVEGDSDSRQRIHRAALARFARDGYEGVSLQQIADDVGLHKSSLFHHYPSKSALLKDVLAETTRRLVAYVRPLQAPEPPSARAMISVLLAVAEHFCDEPSSARLILAVMTAPRGSEFQRHAEEGPEFYEILASYLDRARRSGVIGPIHIRQAIPNLIGLVLVYPAVAEHLTPLVGGTPFSPRARQTRRQDLERAVRALLQFQRD